MASSNKQIVVKSYPLEDLNESNFELTSSSIPVEVAAGSKDVLVKNLYLSPDPYMRGRLRDSHGSYVPPFPLGSVITGYGLSRVVKSDHPDYKENDIVVGMVGWEEYSVIPKGTSLTKITPSDLPLSYFLGVLGMPGLTAYAGLHRICSPKKGEQVFISAASGAVGQLVGQFAKILGCYVVGSAGSNKKVEVLKNELGFDEAFNYKEETDLDAALKRYLPKGIDIYFENVGGKTLEAVLNNINVFGRIAVCGMISQYEKVKGEGITNLTNLIGKRVRMEGFLVMDHVDMKAKFFEDVTKLLSEKKIIYLEDIEEGLEAAPKALIGLLHGANLGKKIIHLAN